MASVVWFDIAADDVERAKKFYGSLFGWKMDKLPGPKEYWHMDTGGKDGSPDGAIMKRQDPHQGITTYISVPSVDESTVKVQELGGKVFMPKTAVPQMGYFAICQDTEKNLFALWEMNEKAK
jgi:predicted enzyme related to lactoylglutathione lyase